MLKLNMVSTHETNPYFPTFHFVLCTFVLLILNMDTKVVFKTSDVRCVDSDYMTWY